MAALLVGDSLVLAGTVGLLDFEDGFTYGDVVLALQAFKGSDITVRINSGGGIASEGLAIHAALAAHKGKKAVIVEGVAASAASVIAMAGDTITMALGALMMVHDPSGMTIGTKADHDEAGRALDTIAASMAAVYATRTGKSVATVRAEMKAETWMTGEEAVTARYATKVETAGKKADMPTAFDFRAYQHAPDRLVAMAATRGWQSQVVKRQPFPAPTPIATPDPDGDMSGLAIIKACREIGEPQLAVGFIEAKMTVRQVREMLSGSTPMRNLVAHARDIAPTAIPVGTFDTFVADDISLEAVRCKLFDLMAEAQDRNPVNSHVRVESAKDIGIASMTSVLRSTGMEPAR